MEQTLENGIADNLLHNIFNDLSVGLELYDKDGLMIDVNYSRLRSMGIKDKKDILGYNLFNYTSFSDEIKEQIRKGCLLCTSPSPRDGLLSRMPSSA